MAATILFSSTSVPEFQRACEDVVNSGVQGRLGETMHYPINECLRACEEAKIRSANTPFVTIFTPEEWAEGRDAYDMDIELDPDLSTSLSTQAETNYDAVTGAIFIPDCANPDLPEARFVFALGEKDVTFVNAQGNALTLVEQIVKNRR